MTQAHHSALLGRLRTPSFGHRRAGLAATDRLVQTCEQAYSPWMYEGLKGWKAFLGGSRCARDGEDSFAFDGGIDIQHLNMITGIEGCDGAAS